MATLTGPSIGYTPQGNRPPTTSPTQSLVFMVGEMKGTLDSVASHLLPKLNEHDHRIASLEQFRARVYGITAVVVVLLPSILYLVTHNGTIHIFAH